MVGKLVPIPQSDVSKHDAACHSNIDNVSEIICIFPDCMCNMWQGYPSVLLQMTQDDDDNDNDDDDDDDDNSEDMMTIM